jgi:hypothetical protein
VIRGIALLWALGALVAMCGCSRRHDLEPRVVDGVAYGVTGAPFRGRWWHYYERGISWAEGGFLQEAEADFRKSLDLRWTDSRRARTYGMRFSQYFAHRELGAVLLRLGRDGEAESELRLSLDQERSAKAQALLERISAQRAAAAPPMSAPELDLDGPDGVVVRGRLWYRYSAQSAAGLARLRVLDGGASCFESSLATTRAAGVISLDLPAGERRLQFTLVDAAGRATALERSVTVRASPSQDRSLRAAALALPLLSPRPDAMRGADDPKLLSALVDDGRFRYLDRRGDAVLQRELLLVDAGMVDRATAAQAGRRLRSRYVVTGTVTRGAHDMECYLRAILVDTGELVAVADAYAENVDQSREQDFFRAVAGRFRQAFPVIAGTAALDGTGVTLDVGTRDGVIERMRFSVLADTTDDVTPPPVRSRVEVTASDHALAHARVLEGAAESAGEVISE